MDAVPFRFPLRTAGFVGLTFSLLAGFETERALSKSDNDKRDTTYRWMQRYGIGLLGLYGIEATARGPYVEARFGRYPACDERGLGRLFVMNHRSMLDVFVTLRYFEANIVSRSDLANWPVIGLAARRVGTLFVDRSDRNSGAQVVQAMRTALEKGRAVMVYPEGTTFAGDEVRPFRGGAFLAAEQVGAEIVPVGIAYEGDSTAYVDEPFVKHLVRVASAPRTRVGLVVGEAFGARGHDASELRSMTREKVQALVNEARGLLNRS